jgi:hypothetical protein
MRMARSWINGWSRIWTPARRDVCLPAPAKWGRGLLTVAPGLLRQRVRHRPEPPQRGAAAQAGLHVRPQPREVFRARLAVGERRQQRLIAGALGAALDP